MTNNVHEFEQMFEMSNEIQNADDSIVEEYISCGYNQLEGTINLLFRGKPTQAGHKLGAFRLDI